MAVYTVLDDEALSKVSAAWRLGPIRGAEPIPQGSINTNYKLLTDSGPIFLRHTTVRTGEDLAFEAELLAHLHQHRLAVPTLLPTAHGDWWLPLVGGRVSLFRWLAGEELPRAAFTPEHLEALGAALGRLHRATEDFGGSRANPYGAATVAGWVEALRGHADPALRTAAEVMAETLAEVEAHQPELDPRGVIHGDLFPDNVKWLGEKVAALFDFEMACHDVYGLDVAITLNAWCFDGGYQPALARALLRGYTGERPLALHSVRALYPHARFGAVRFCASRIRDYHLPGFPPERLKPKDWRTYLARVRALNALGERGFLALLGVSPRG
ncbi:MAG: homoserine kinase [Myxococcaceae bacterium]|nr:homoserine kinase [Myxococcaceae bacterium]MCI0673771.1 homoserine kinase [Myxococcaceae bacterium]